MLRLPDAVRSATRPTAKLSSKLQARSARFETPDRFVEEVEDPSPPSTPPAHPEPTRGRGVSRLARRFQAGRCVKTRPWPPIRFSTDCRLAVNRAEAWLEFAYEFAAVPPMKGMCSGKAASIMSWLCRVSENPDLQELADPLQSLSEQRRRWTQALDTGSPCYGPAEADRVVQALRAATPGTRTLHGVGYRRAMDDGEIVNHLVLLTFEKEAQGDLVVRIYDANGVFQRGGSDSARRASRQPQSAQRAGDPAEGPEELVRCMRTVVLPQRNTLSWRQRTALARLFDTAFSVRVLTYAEARARVYGAFDALTEGGEEGPTLPRHFFSPNSDGRCVTRGLLALLAPIPSERQTSAVAALRRGLRAALADYEGDAQASDSQKKACAGLRRVLAINILDADLVPPGPEALQSVDRGEAPEPQPHPIRNPNYATDDTGSSA